MSLYNLVFGENPDAKTILASIGCTESDFYRYRDVRVGETIIDVYTRGGGNNRTCYCHEYNSKFAEDEHDADCVEPIQDKLRTHPLYNIDYDDSFDNTYCTFQFKRPDTLTDDQLTDAKVRGEAAWPLLKDAIDNMQVVPNR